MAKNLKNNFNLQLGQGQFVDNCCKTVVLHIRTVETVVVGCWQLTRGKEKRHRDSRIIYFRLFSEQIIYFLFFSLLTFTVILFCVVVINSSYFNLFCYFWGNAFLHSILERFLRFYLFCILQTYLYFTNY